MQPLVSVDTARRLRDAGLRWTPERGDHFIVADRGMDDELFVLSDLTIEVHDYPGGPVFGFNGTTEWALDSVPLEVALWLPREDQLRELIGDRFVGLRFADGSWRVQVRRMPDGHLLEAADPDAECAYAKALLLLA